MSNWRDDKKPDPVIERYRNEVGDEALCRQEAHVAASRCPICWTFPNEPHNLLSPNRPADQEDAPVTQEEGLF